MQVTTVVLKVNPPQAHFYYKGKSIGTTKITIELEPGEKRAFEVGLYGYKTRRVTVDASKPERTVGLVPKDPEPENQTETPAPEE